MNILAVQFQFYLYKGDDIVHRTNNWDEAVKYKHEHDGVEIYTHRV